MQSIFDAICTPYLRLDPTTVLLRKRLRGGGSGYDVTETGDLPLTLANCLHEQIVALTRYGKCELRVKPWEGQPVGVGNPTTAAAFTEKAFVAYNYSTTNYNYSVVSCEEDTYCFMVLSTNSVSLIIATKNNTTFTTPHFYFGVLNSTPSQYTALYDSTSGLYYSEISNSVPSSAVTPYCPVFSSRAEGLAAIKAVVDGTAVVTPTPSNPCEIWCNNGIIKVSRNLCDVVSANIVVGKYINNSGVETSDTANFYYATYIPVTPGGTYTMATSSSIWYFSVMQYDSSKNFLRRTVWGATNTPVGTEKTFSVGADCAYIRFGSNMKKATITEDDVLAVNWMLTETATALDYRPYGEIYIDGASEVLTVGGQNLVDLTAVTNGYYYDPNGVLTEAAVARLTDYIPVKAGQKYTVYVNAARVGTAANVRCNLFDTEKVWKSQSSFTIASGAEAVSTITATENGYLRVSANYTGTGARVDWSTLQIVRGEYTLATMPPYEPYHAPQTASVPMLLSVGNYKDEGELVSGIKTGKVGVLVMDGTENWGRSDVRVSLIISDAAEGAANEAWAICTHYNVKPGSLTISSMPDNSCKINSGTNTLLIKDTTHNTGLAAWKAYLASEYANGTPVIMLYVLATETTEQTTPQALHSYDGTTIVDSVCAVEPVPAEITYKSSVAA